MLKIIIAAYTSLTIIPLLIEFYLRKYQRNYTISNNNDTYYKCMFTSVNNSRCRQHIIYDKRPCGATCSYVMQKNIIDFISSATESISLCMYLLTSLEICNAILESHKKGKQVRVIVDERMWGCSGSKGRILLRHGVPVKVQEKDGSLMHHKFCLIDENISEAKLFIGTVNLTLQGFCSNWDTFVYTNDKEVIESLKAEFQELWSAFSVYQRK